MQLTTKFARVAAGAAIVGAAGLTTAVAVAQGGSGPEGSYADYGYGYGGDYGGVGAARGHPLHCPSYNGMYHSKGHAQCHYAPRGHAYGVLGAEDENTAGTTSQTELQNKTASRHDAEVRSDDDTKGTTSSTEADDQDEQNEDKATSSTTEHDRPQPPDAAGDHAGPRQDGGHRHRGSDSTPYETND